MLSLEEKVTKFVTSQPLLRRVPLRSKKTALFCSPVEHCNKPYLSGRASLYGSALEQGSMTLEAALILPFFLLVMLSILSFLEIIRLHDGITMGVREAGKQMAVYGYVFRETKDLHGQEQIGLLPGVALSYVWAGKEVEDFLGQEMLENAPFGTKERWIHYEMSSLMAKDDIIDLVAFYTVAPQYNIAGVRKRILTGRYYARAWTGYCVEGENTGSVTEENVYVTPGGEVYHRNRYCTHLQLTIMTCTRQQLKQRRNERGNLYAACIFCGSFGTSGKVYITPEGDRYHSTLRCQGLKRTIDIIPISKVGDRSPCSRCGG